MKRVISNENCCVFGCKSVRRKNSDLMYHRFPKSGEKIKIENELGLFELQDRRKIWENKLRMGKKVTKSMKVCSLHFTEDSYECSGWSSVKRLKLTAVPNQNLPQSTCNKSLKSDLRQKNSRQVRIMKRNSEQNTHHVLGEIDSSHNNNEACSQDIFQNLEDLKFKHCATQCEQDLLGHKSIGTQVMCSDFNCKKDAEVQVNTSEVLTVCDFIKTDKQLSSVTGISSFVLLHMIVKLFSSVINDKRIHRLSAYKRVFLTFMKMKLDLSYIVLSILFRVSSQTCKNVFYETVTSLVPIMRCAIPFPSREETRQNMPKCFKEFSRVRLVLDCTEIPVQRHKKLCCQIKCYSHYKGTTTLKFMTAVTPAGLICYVSPAYGGRTSDKIIFEKSGLLDEIDMYLDEIMVDKGFHIDSLCENFGIKLIRPPFLRKKTKFSQAEAILTSKIASARVHIERTSQRIKIFKILTNRLPVNLVCIADYIFEIVCAVVNLSNPILADDKFINN